MPLTKNGTEEKRSLLIQFIYYPFMTIRFYLCTLRFKQATNQEILLKIDLADFVALGNGCCIAHSTSIVIVSKIPIGDHKPDLQGRVIIIYACLNFYNLECVK